MVLGLGEGNVNPPEPRRRTWVTPLSVLTQDRLLSPGFPGRS